MLPDPRAPKGYFIVAQMKGLGFRVWVATCEAPFISKVKY